MSEASSWSGFLAEQLQRGEPEHIVLIGPYQSVARHLLHLKERDCGAGQCQTSQFAHWQEFLDQDWPSGRSQSRVVALIAPQQENHGLSLDVLLGAATRTFPWRVVVDNAQPSTHASSRFFAYGFRLLNHKVRVQPDAQLNEQHEVNTGRQLYEFSLANYKQAPDWLNSRFWAHPERFNSVE